MKKILTAAVLVVALAACSNETPSPEASDEPLESTIPVASESVDVEPGESTLVEPSQKPSVEPVAPSSMAAVVTVNGSPFEIGSDEWDEVGNGCYLDFPEPGFLTVQLMVLSSGSNPGDVAGVGVTIPNFDPQSTEPITDNFGVTIEAIGENGPEVFVISPSDGMGGGSITIDGQTVRVIGTSVNGEELALVVSCPEFSTGSPFDG